MTDTIKTVAIKLSPEIKALIDTLQAFSDAQKQVLASNLDTFAKSVQWLDNRRNLYARFEIGDIVVQDIVQIVANCADWFWSGPQYAMAGEAASLAALELYIAEPEPFFLKLLGIEADSLTPAAKPAKTKKGEA